MLRIKKKISLRTKTDPRTLKFYLQEFDPIEIEYDSIRGRVIKIFTNETEARDFYIRKEKSGDKPKILPLKKAVEDAERVLEKNLSVNNTHKRSIKKSTSKLKDVTWTENKVITYKALRSLGATSIENSVSVPQIVRRIKDLGGNVNDNYVRYYCRRGVPAGYIKITRIDGYKGHLIYLTELGALLDYDKERLKHYPDGIDIYHPRKNKR